MRIKNKASGLKSVPVPDRIYFNIQHPGKAERVSPVFVSKLWTLGKNIQLPSGIFINKVVKTCR